MGYIYDAMTRTRDEAPRRRRRRPATAPDASPTAGHPDTPASGVAAATTDAQPALQANAAPQVDPPESNDGAEAQALPVGNNASFDPALIEVTTDAHRVARSLAALDAIGRRRAQIAAQRSNARPEAADAAPAATGSAAPDATNAAAQADAKDNPSAAAETIAQAPGADASPAFPDAATPAPAPIEPSAVVPAAGGLKLVGAADHIAGAQPEHQPAAAASPKTAPAAATAPPVPPVDADTDAADDAAAIPQPIVAHLDPNGGAKLDDRLVVASDPLSVIAEEYRSIRTGILARWQQKRHLVHLITSATPQEGKTITSLNMGMAFAELHSRRTIVIEADLRLPQFSTLLGLPQGPGVIDVLEGKASINQVITRLPGIGLHVIPAGGRAAGQAIQLLSNSVTTSFVRQLRQEFDHVIIDTPPVVQLADAGILGALSDDVLLIVRLGRTPTTLVNHAIRTLASYNAPVAGVIATDDRHYRNRYHYRYEYRYASRSRRAAG